MFKNPNSGWWPAPGDLVFFRANKKFYHVLEVSRTAYGFFNLTAFGSGELTYISTLNCELVEHAEKNSYNNNMSKGEKMTTTEKIKSLELPPETKVNLKYSLGTDVLHYNETEIETALENTDVVSSYVTAITTPGLNLKTTWGEDPISHLRSQGLLEDYTRNGEFEGYLCETIVDNFYDAEVISYSTEKYDHKRGFTTLTAELYTTVGDMIEFGDEAELHDWKVTVETNAGDLILS